MKKQSFSYKDKKRKWIILVYSNLDTQWVLLSVREPFVFYFEANEQLCHDSRLLHDHVGSPLLQFRSNRWVECPWNLISQYFTHKERATSFTIYRIEQRVCMAEDKTSGWDSVQNCFLDLTIFLWTFFVWKFSVFLAYLFPFPPILLNWKSRYIENKKFVKLRKQSPTKSRPDVLSHVF